MREHYKSKILKLLRHSDYEPAKLSQLAEALGVSQEDYSEFKHAFEELRQSGHVILGEGSMVELPALSGRITGTFRANPRGFGFVTPMAPAAHVDLFIPPGETLEAMTGDIVVARVVEKTRRGQQVRYSGRVLEILERGQNRLVGTLVKKPEGWIVQPDGAAFVEPVSVDDVTAKGAKEKDKVVVELLSYPSQRYYARGVIIEVLGKAGRYETEINSIIHQYHLPYEFSGSALVEAHQAAKNFNPAELAGREDIRDRVVVTIDPPDAKDFDDAISIEKDGSGKWVLGVHIADVSWFVPAGSALDIEARNRGNSVYLPGRVIPMLPEMLSNGVCSLQPGQPRFVKSAYITYDEEGDILSRRYANGIICSTQRLTYQQVDRFLKGHTKDIKPEVALLLRDMNELARIIERRRERNGMLHLDLPEIELVMDESGRVIDGRPADTSYPHTIIEMFMVEANEAVAAILDKSKIPFMRRIHPDPDNLTMQNLSQLVRALGLHLPRTPDRRALQDLLRSVKGRENSLAINIVVLRSLERARYSPLHIGHYALASKLYCHFTSPIRRYADLLVHRALDCYLNNTIETSPEGYILDKEQLTQIGEHITFTEERAEDAENELKTVLILQMLSEKVGEELDCVVTGLTNFGVFVKSLRFGVEGLVQLTDLGADQWQYNPKAGCIVGRHTGMLINLGQPMRVKIVSVNVAARQLNVAPITPLVGIISQSRKTKKHKMSGGRFHKGRCKKRR